MTFFERLSNVITAVEEFLWGLPMIVVLFGMGFFLTLWHRFPQIRWFPRAVRILLGRVDVVDPDSPGIPPRRALFTALSATVGLGNIGAVAVAIGTGGPGAALWMMLLGLVGMVTKFNEVTLARLFREELPDGSGIRGGPMYYIQRVPFAGRFWAAMYAGAMAVAALGAANLFQSNQVSLAVEQSFGADRWLVGLIIAALTAVAVIGGVRFIASCANVLVPVMGFTYVGSCAIVILLHVDDLPSAVSTIVHDAFTGTAAVGGFVGATFQVALTQGFSRALFSSEAGLGTSATAHAQGASRHPLDSGLMALLEPFIDTVIVCSFTAITIVVTGAWQSGNEDGVTLTQAALDSGVSGLGTYFIPFAVFLFGISTIIAWSIYGDQAMRFLGGEKRPWCVGVYRAIYCLCPIAGALWPVGFILSIASIAFAFLVIPNAIAFIYLSHEVKRHDREYEDFIRTEDRR